MIFAGLAASLLVILIGAKFFCNGVEWLGNKLGLARGAVGSVLAALGTALPETMIPVVAILFGTSNAAQHVGTGAILGAPFMLATVGFGMAGLAAIGMARHRGVWRIVPDAALARRDLSFFLVTYTVAIGAAFLPPAIRSFTVVVLIGGYFLFLVRAVTQGERFGEGEKLEPLLVAPRLPDPPLSLVAGQVLCAFLAIFFGAKIFVQNMGVLAHNLGVAPFLFSLLIAPVATEMPELFNSVIWIRERKDTLAMGNITGAMVFQSSLVPCLGIALTPWQLTSGAFFSAGITLASGLAAYIYLRRNGFFNSWFFVLAGGVFYALFVLAVVKGIVC
ncbi:MAG: sodium:calcium antiporter [Peptococcaceae bacterium]|nr:sodium:calcium antiporter [Peptococcaceae bacterium]